MSKCSPSWKQVLIPAIVWVGTVAVFAIPLAYMIIYAAAQMAYRAFDNGAAAPGATRFVAFGESVLLVVLLVVVPLASGLAHRSWKVAGLAALLIAVLSFWIGIVLRSFYLYYAKPVIARVDKPAPRPMSAATSDISPDEEVVFFPTSAYLDENSNTWTVPIHGIIYEPERGSLSRDALATVISEVLQVKPGTPEAENLDRRVRLFLVDNERGQDMSIRIGQNVYGVGTSGPNGHFQREIRLSADEIGELLDEQETEDPFFSFEAVTRKSDNRRFVGRVQLVGPTGLSIISDIDDTIKHSQIGDHKAVLANTFLHNFRAVPGMAALYAQCAQKGAVFHYVSGSPWQLYLPLSEFLAAEGFPPGSFDLKLFRLKDASALNLLESPEAMKLPAIGRLMTAYPKRRFILIGDSGEQDPEIYAKVAQERGDQVAAIFIRNVTGEKIDAARFQTLREGLADSRFILFDQPGELQPALEEVRHLHGGL